MADVFDHGRFTVARVPTGGPLDQCCYVVRDTVTGAQIVVDPGGAAAEVREAAERGGVPVVAVVLTHAHHDHVRAAADVATHFGVRCHIHSADFPLLRKAPMYSVAFGGRPFAAVKDPVALESAPDPFAPGAMRVLHTPGHTPGSCCLLFPGFAFTGDTLLPRQLGRTDLPGSDREALVASVDDLLRRTAAGDVLYGGHDGPWRADEARAWWRGVRGHGSAVTPSAGRV